MKTRDLILVVLGAIVMGSCADNMMQNEPAQEFTLSRSGETTSSGEYTVTSEMVCKYINITHKGRRINSLTPIVQNGDTLAYVAQYADSLGWELISGDRRVEPVLAFADNGVLNYSDTENPAVNAIHGMINIVKTAKESSDTLKNNIWAFLEPKIKGDTNPIQSRGNGTGKWIAIDTVYDSYTTKIPRIIQTHWGQGAEYNSFTPFIDGQHALVGCVPIAVGQVIAQYRKNNHRNIEIPSSANFIGSQLEFYDFSTSNWSVITDTSISSPADDAFLAYISLDMDLDYGIDGTKGDEDDVTSVLSKYKLTYSKSNNYDYTTIYSNLLSSKPVIIFSGIKDSEKSHAFIIDGLKKQVTQYYVTYMWDPYYELQEGEDSQLPPAETDNEGYAWKDTIIDASEIVSFAMNWGQNDASMDNTYYLAYNFKHGIYSIYYTPSWTVNGVTMNNVTKMFYNISEAVE